jgi:hypothetical protein
MELAMKFEGLTNKQRFPLYRIPPLQVIRAWIGAWIRTISGFEGLKVYQVVDYNTNFPLRKRAVIWIGTSKIEVYSHPCLTEEETSKLRKNFWGDQHG